LGFQHVRLNISVSLIEGMRSEIIGDENQYISHQGQQK